MSLWILSTFLFLSEDFCSFVSLLMICLSVSIFTTKLERNAFFLFQLNFYTAFRLMFIHAYIMQYRPNTYYIMNRIIKVCATSNIHKILNHTPGFNAVLFLVGEYLNM